MSEMGRRRSKKNLISTWMHQRQSVQLWPFSLSSENSRRKRQDHSPSGEAASWSTRRHQVQPPSIQK
ncbi:Purkinje cell protein 4, isoform CRA_c [Rattus norvegicus]|uniref:Purkinje cell protein 4, isoform CRA_c n=1 Tax=Rattus norvegicus TaxID=10116 RepID=A6IQF3_RAT|nr:Purkinje cell protein 4, isoform CRA_c [Rattus norvegicus]